MKSKIQEFFSRQYSEFYFKNSLNLFTKLFLVWLFVSVAVLLPHYEEIWGPSSIYALEKKTELYGIEWVTRLALSEYLYEYSLEIICIYLLLLGVAIFRSRASRLLFLAILILNHNIAYLNQEILDGGTNLSELLLFYLVLIKPGEKGDYFFKYNNFSANLFFHVLRLQVVLVYLCASIYKLNGDLWQKGMSLFYILQNAHYSHPFLLEKIVDYPELSMVATYTVLIFQFSFAFLIWDSRTRKLLIPVGIAIHLGIAFGMGLFMFGLVMCLSYSLFISEGTSAKVSNTLMSLFYVPVDVAHRAFKKMART